MTDFLSGTVCSLALFAGLLGGIAWARARWKVHPELCRKFAHVVMGVASLAFPVFVSGNWQILLLAAAFIAALAWMRLSSSPRIMGADVFRISRGHSMGEYYFVIGVASAHILADGDRFVYATAVALLAFADAAACAVGRTVGRSRCWGNAKTLEGSLAFAGTAALCILSLAVWTGVNPGLVPCAVLCLLATVAEGLSTKDSDNLLVPLACVCCLRLPDWLPAQAGSGVWLAALLGGSGMLAVRMIRRNPAF
jgi:dolichol kinase